MREKCQFEQDPCHLVTNIRQTGKGSVARVEFGLFLSIYRD